MDAYRKHCLLNGLDNIGITMTKAKAIDSYETKSKADKAWL
jgi:3-isopropylmalate/(R)-2-methylmalate dehydratase small subunit